MLALLIALSISTDPISGGWQTISIDSEQMKVIKPYLDRNLPHLFPEIEQKGYTIASAKIQVVNGMNYQLMIKVTNKLSFKLSLFVEQQGKTIITDIIRPLGIRPIIGGFNWLNPASFATNDFDRLVMTIQKKVNLLVAKQGTVLVYRKQIVNGIKEHIVFRDANQNVFSAIIIGKPYSLTDDLISVYQIY